MIKIEDIELLIEEHGDSRVEGDASSSIDLKEAILCAFRDLNSADYLINEEDAGNFRNLLRARVMIGLGDESPAFKAIAEGFEDRVKNDINIMVGGS